jgi:putative glutamine amidotransferase
MTSLLPHIPRVLCALLLALAVACEPPAPARPPASPVAPAGSADILASQSAPSASADASQPDPATLAGPTIAYNGDLGGDVGPSMVEARLREAGAVPLRLTVQNQHLLDSAHALVLVGGDDIDPKRYGERVHNKVRVLSPARETFDFQLIEAATSLRLPMLGICLGAQELWVAARGTLIQDIPSEIGTKVNHRAKEALHPVTLIPGSKLAAIYGEKPLSVFSNHHQAVDAKQSVPVGFVVSATSSDGVAEAFESAPNSPVFVLGVGWHPEKRDDERVLFESLVAQAKVTQQQTTAAAR